MLAMIGRQGGERGDMSRGRCQGTRGCGTGGLSAHRDVLGQRCVVEALEGGFDIEQVHLRARHYDPDQRLVVGAQALRVRWEPGQLEPSAPAVCARTHLHALVQLFCEKRRRIPDDLHCEENPDSQPVSRMS